MKCHNYYQFLIDSRDISGVNMGKRDKQKGSAEERVNEGFSAAASPPRHEANARANMDEGLALTTILEELRDFRREFQTWSEPIIG